MAAFRSIDTARSAGLNLAVVAPLDEFFGEIEAARRSLFMVALRLRRRDPAGRRPDRLAALRRLRRIAVETDRIQRFDIDDEPRQVRSVIREIDDLGRSVATMRTVVRPSRASSRSASSSASSRPATRSASAGRGGR